MPEANENDLNKNFLFLVALLITALLPAGIISCAGSAAINETIPPAAGNQAASGIQPEEKNYFHILRNTPESGTNLYFYGFSPYYLDKAALSQKLFDSASLSYMIFRGIDGISAFSYRNINFSPDIYRKIYIGTDDIPAERINEFMNLYYQTAEPLIPFAIYAVDKKKGSEIYGKAISARDFVFDAIPESTPDKVPGWVFRLPESDRYIFSVGIAERHSSFADSLARADSNALEEMIKQKSVKIVSETAPNSSAEITSEVSSVYLKGFYVIRRWWDSDMKNYYSLAVSEKQHDGV